MFLPLTQILILDRFHAVIISRIHTALLEILLVLFPLIIVERSSGARSRVQDPVVAERLDSKEPNKDTNPTYVQSKIGRVSDNPFFLPSKTLPLYFFELQHHRSAYETIPSSNQIPPTPFLSAFMGLMSCLYQSSLEEGGANLAELPPGMLLTIQCYTNIDKTIS